MPSRHNLISLGALTLLPPSARTAYIAHASSPQRRHQQLLHTATSAATAVTASSSAYVCPSPLFALGGTTTSSFCCSARPWARRTLATLATDSPADASFSNEGGHADSDDAATSTATPSVAEKSFLIANSGNDVQRLFCTTPQILRQGILETSQLPHVCVAGESNAGKSSLINHLLVKKSLARASSVAGKTRSVDMMLVNEKVVVTDLPGLPSRDHQVTDMWEGAWRPLVFEYLEKCDGLRCMLYVHDVRWKVSYQVRAFLDEVRATGVPVFLVLTKDDRIQAEIERKRGEPRLIADPAKRQAFVEKVRGETIETRQRYMTRIRRALGFEGVHLHYSVDSEKPASRKARRKLLRYIESMVESGSREGCQQMLEGVAGEKHNVPPEQRAH